jgi:hypothetical protein
MRLSGVALLLMAGCMQILGLEERTVAVDAGAGASQADRTSPTLATGQCGGLHYPSTSCSSCMDLNCCADAKGCGSDPGCLEASDCIANCSDDACRARCAAFYTMPDTMINVRACRTKHCADACGTSCGEFVTSNATCQACRKASCCAEAATCAANPACAALDRCRTNCFSSTTCPVDCGTQYPDGATDFNALFHCTDQCASSCVPGQDWACLDKPIIWPKPKGTGTITFSVTFVDFTSESPFVGAMVKACAKLDFMCSTPHSTGTTDATGLVTLTVPAGLAGFDGYLDVTGGKLGGTGGAIFPSLWYPIPFVVADGWRGRTQILSAEEFNLLTLVTGKQLDSTRGHFAATATDCDFGVAPGVSFVADGADPASQPFYIVGSGPAATATETDTSGIGGFINLPATPARLLVVRAFSGMAGGKTMGTTTFILRPGALTFASLFPPLP